MFESKEPSFINVLDFEVSFCEKTKYLYIISAKYILHKMDITAYTYCEDKNMESYLVLKRDVDAGVGVKFVPGFPTTLYTFSH